jgi:hypothetical protein
MVPTLALPKLGRANYLAKLFAAAVSPRSRLKSERKNQNFGRDPKSWPQSKRAPAPAVNAKNLAWQSPATIQTDPFSAGIFSRLSQEGECYSKF